MTQLPLTFRALANLSRLRIVNILSYQSLCVSDLQTVLGLPQPFISRHLAYLRKVRLVRNQREGSRVYYYMGFENSLASALHSFLREALALSRTFQTDLERLIGCSRSGQLKSSAACSAFGGWERATEAETPRLTSRAA
jgi:ArsR family transcriptional regulator